MSRQSPLEIAKKIDALGLWDEAQKYNFVLKPASVAFPYFFSMQGPMNQPMVVRRLMFIEGWQTFHDYVHLLANREYGLLTSPLEFSHYEAIYLKTGDVGFYRYKPGFVPRSPAPGESELLVRLLWQTYGVLMRLETENAMPMKYADARALFSRVETVPGEWRDEPFPIPAEKPYREEIAIPSGTVKKAKDLPVENAWAVEADFGPLPGMVTREAENRYAYRLAVADAATGEMLLDRIGPVSGVVEIRRIWLELAARLMEFFIDRGKVPGEIKVGSERVMRVLRPLGLELPVKISLHDRLVRIRPPEPPTWK